MVQVFRDEQRERQKIVEMGNVMQNGCRFDGKTFQRIKTRLRKFGEINITTGGC